MDGLDKLEAQMNAANDSVETVARFIQNSGWNGTVEEVKEGDQLSDPAIVLDVPTTDTEVRLSIGPNGDLSVWEGFGISRTVDSGFSVGDVMRILYDDYSELEDTPWDGAVN